MISLGGAEKMLAPKTKQGLGTASLQPWRQKRRLLLSIK
jgi:hypothetical protein